MSRGVESRLDVARHVCLGLGMVSIETNSYHLSGLFLLIYFYFISLEFLIVQTFKNLFWILHREFLHQESPGRAPPYVMFLNHVFLALDTREFGYVGEFSQHGEDMPCNKKDV